MNSPMKDASSMRPAVGSFAAVESEPAAGRLDDQLAELIEFVWACEAAAARAERIDAARRWGCRESRNNKEK
jgi:hypothetical protein